MEDRREPRVASPSAAAGSFNSSTKLDKIKNLHHYFRFGGVIVHLPCFARWGDQPGATGQPLLVQYEVAEPLPYQQGLFVCAGEWLALGRGKPPFQRASHCALLRAIRGWPVGNEGAAPTHFARPDLVTASTTGGSQRLNGECRQPGGACDGGQPRGRGVGSACLAHSYLPASSFVPRY